MLVVFVVGGLGWQKALFDGRYFSSKVMVMTSSMLWPFLRLTLMKAFLSRLALSFFLPLEVLDVKHEITIVTCSKNDDQYLTLKKKMSVNLLEFCLIK